MESLRWGQDRQVCPHCGTIGGHYFLKPRAGTRKTRIGAITERRLWKCSSCRRQFSVLTGTVLHRTKVPVRIWLFVLFEMCAAKNGLAAREVERKYGLTPRTAWFVTQRIREAMKRPDDTGLFSGTVIADETWIGGKARNRHRGQRHGTNYRDEKVTVFALVHRESGEVRSQVIADVRGKTLRAAIEAQVDLPATDLHTDHHHPYVPIGWKARSHGRVNHSMSEYVRDGITTNHAEGYFSQLKRSLDGTHHHVSREHLGRYLAEFDYRYTTCKMTDSARMQHLANRVAGRRLTYRESRSDSSEALVA
jgi:transposase-like protein